MTSPGAHQRQQPNRNQDERAESSLPSNGAPAESSLPSKAQRLARPPLSNPQSQQPHVVPFLEGSTASAASSGAGPSQKGVAEEENCKEANLPSDIICKLQLQAPPPRSNAPLPRLRPLPKGQRKPPHLIPSLEGSSASAASSGAGPSEGSPIHMNCEKANLPSDLVLEILYRCPARFVQRFALTSRSWRNLIAEPTVGKKLAHPFAGFFYQSYDFFRDPPVMRFFARICGCQYVDACLSFLPNARQLELVDTCNGLLLCRSPFPSELRYTVCNPATKRSLKLPPSPTIARDLISTCRLGFEPAVTSHFHVFELLDIQKLQSVSSVNIFSSETGCWTHRSSGWSPYLYPQIESRSIFISQRIYILTKLSEVAVVDTKGEIWQMLSDWAVHFIGVSQGKLHCIATVSDTKIMVLSLEDFDRRSWVCKLQTSKDELFQRGGEVWKVIGIHPDYDSLFLATKNDTKLASFNMELRKFQNIVDLEEEAEGQYFPYVPVYADQLPDV